MLSTISVFTGAFYLQAVSSLSRQYVAIKFLAYKLVETCFNGVSIYEIVETNLDIFRYKTGNWSMNPKHLMVLDGSAQALAKWHRDNSPERLDLRGADLKGRDLSGRDFSRALMEGADLSGAKLDGAVFSEASLRRANLSGASLKKAILYRTNCTGADVSNVDMRGANMYRCVLRDANIEGANFKSATIFKVAWPEGANVRSYG
ncbi:MAG: pentapeptide repeat-containing protein [SAR202 cluster bacterium]|nr:hypothetical protein [Chloroflexota bacterium]MQG87755.1 pentapeptide repeat-containing protein [SAR202 cluster bacterium]|tara:strand:+ start:5199 stop:5810 length:612 start_codon:yes stop_codon:yes gene_type:complete